MSVYTKLAKARRMLLNSKLQKSGKGYGFSYFELSDFLPRTTEIFDELKLASFTTITTESAKMTIVDGEDETQMTFEIPFANFKSDEKRSLQEVQELGGSVTYMTRYLWVQVMNIVEPDTVDRNKDEVVKETRTESKPIENKVYETVWWDGVSPIKQFDHFMVGDIEYVTMLNKNNGELFGLAVDKSITDPKVKYYKFM